MKPSLIPFEFCSRARLDDKYVKIIERRKINRNVRGFIGGGNSGAFCFVLSLSEKIRIVNNGMVFYESSDLT